MAKTPRVRVSVQKRRGPKVRVSYAKCVMFSTLPMACPLCGADVPPSTVHTCKRLEGQ